MEKVFYILYVIDSHHGSCRYVYTGDIIVVVIKEAISKMPI